MILLYVKIFDIDREPEYCQKALTGRREMGAITLDSAKNISIVKNPAKRCVKKDCCILLQPIVQVSLKYCMTRNEFSKVFKSVVVEAAIRKSGIICRRTNVSSGQTVIKDLKTAKSVKDDAYDRLIALSGYYLPGAMTQISILLLDCKKQIVHTALAGSL